MAARARARSAAAKGLREISTVSCAPQPLVDPSRPTITCRQGSGSPSWFSAAMASETSRKDSRGGSRPQRVKAHHAVVGQVQQVIAERVGGVEIVLRKREGAGRGGGPGIHQGGLHHLVFLLAAAHEAAAVFHEDAHVGAQIDAAALRPRTIAHHGGGDDGVDLDAGDIVAAGSQRAGHVPAAAGADDQRLGAGPHGIGQGGPCSSSSWRSRAVRCAKSKLAMPVEASASMKME